MVRIADARQAWGLPIKSPESARITRDDAAGRLESSLAVKVRNYVLKFFEGPNQIALNVLGYIPLVSTISGMVRMAAAGVLAMVSLFLRDYNTLDLAVGHAARGAIEAFAPFSAYINGSLDVGVTLANAGEMAYKRAVDSVPR